MHDVGLYVTLVVIVISHSVAAKKWNSGHDRIVRCLGYMHAEADMDRVIL